MPIDHAVTLRAYQADDLDAVIAVFVSAVRDVACRDYEPAQIEAWAQVDREGWEKRRLSRPTWVAMLDDQVVGFSDLEPDGHLDMMFVHAAHQGRGIASLLLETVEGAARRQNLAAVSTEASLTARPFFERRGFAIQKEQQVLKRGQILTNFRMCKRLGSDPRGCSASRP